MFRLKLLFILFFNIVLVFSCASFRIEPVLDQSVDAILADNQDQAVLMLEKAIANRPDSASIHNNLAVAYEKMGRYDQAALYYKKAYQLAPENGCIRANIKLFFNDHPEDHFISNTAIFLSASSRGQSCRTLAMEIDLPVASWIDNAGALIVCDLKTLTVHDDFALGKELSDYLFRELSRPGKAEILRAELLVSAEDTGPVKDFVRQANLPENSLALAGCVSLAEEKQKAVLPSQGLRYSPFDASRDQFVVRKIFSLTAELAVIKLIDNSTVYSRTFEETQQVNVLEFSASSAILPLFESVKNKLQSDILGAKTLKERFVLVREIN